MSAAAVKVRRVSGSVVITIAKGVFESLGWEEGDLVVMESKGEKLAVMPLGCIPTVEE